MSPCLAKPTALTYKKNLRAYIHIYFNQLCVMKSISKTNALASIENSVFNRCAVLH